MQRGQIDARAFNLNPLHPDPPLHTDLGGAEKEPPKRGRNPKEVLATSRGKTHALSQSSAYQTLPSAEETPSSFTSLPLVVSGPSPLPAV